MKEFSAYSLSMETLNHPNPEKFSFSGRGEVYSYTVIYDAPARFVQFAPYAIALIRLSEGNLVTAQLTDVDFDQIYIGLPVEMVTRKLSEDGDRGLISYGYKFRPIITPTEKNFRES